VKIGPVDTEIALLLVKNKEKKKLMQAKYIALPASLPSGLNIFTKWSLSIIVQICGNIRHFLVSIAIWYQPMLVAW